jgi:ketosteroid isomerase-like protein
MKRLDDAPESRETEGCAMEEATPDHWRICSQLGMRCTSGREQVRENWSNLYGSIPDFRDELLRIAIVGEEEWGEWIWRGTKEDGTPLEERGVTIMGIRNGRIAWGRLYLEETEREGADITETVRRMAGREEV